MGDISGGLSSKRARINGTDSLRGGEIVVKAQVQVGGRGKAGGIKLADNADAARSVSRPGVRPIV